MPTKEDFTTHGTVLTVLLKTGTHIPGGENVQMTFLVAYIWRAIIGGNVVLQELKY